VADRSRRICDRDGCEADAVEEIDRCWGHAGGPEVEPALRRLADRPVLVARGVGFTVERLTLVIEALPRHPDGIPCLDRLDAQDAWFAPGVSFDGVHFTGDVSFEGATFRGGASFDRCVFEGSCWFTGARFAEHVTFRETRFCGRTWFGGATFGTGVFVDATFEEDVSFQDAVFADRAGFEAVRFAADLVCTGVRGGAVAFDRVTFGGTTTFADVEVRGELGLARCDFSTSRHVGRIDCGMLDIGESTWHERVAVDAVADRVVAAGSRFLAGAQLRLGRAEVTLADADLAAPSILRPAGTAGDPPRLVSVAGADVQGATFSRVDLAACELAGAHHLSELRLDGCTFASTPRAWWRTRRQVIAEEVQWRAAHAAHRPARRAWARVLAPGQIEPRGPIPEVRVTADQVANVYRELRRGREDAKDEPGAADFYYGEMEMRRLATGSRHLRAGSRSALGAAGEHAILTLYWLLAGYGLRAWRALGSLGALILVTGVVFARWGIERRADPGLDDGLLLSARSSTIGLLESDPGVTAVGAWLQLAVRLLGPLLLALALLAMRGRIRR
jgi:uncharacterized protein YjbI with pentapeptide repeats